MLKIENLHAYYGKSHVLHGVSFGIEPGEIVALLGRNGSGRSTTAKAIMGLVDWEGTIAWKGGDLARFAGKPVRFRFNLRVATLYSFWVSRKPTGESGGYVAAGGPAYKGLKDE